jgi:hypothetical protein
MDEISRRRRAGRVALIGGAVLVTAWMLFASMAGNALATSTGPAAPSTSTWAYGVLKEANFSGTLTGPLGVTYTYTAHATVGFATVITESPAGTGLYEINASRAMGSILDVAICRPNCVVPLATGSIDHRVWESINASALLTSSGSVNVSGTPTPALALVSSSLAVAAGLHESSAYLLGGIPERTDNLSASFVGHSNVTLTPPLGLVPLNLSSEETWSSSSAFAQSGAFNWSILDIRGGALVVHPHTYTNSGNGSFAHSGTLTLSGRDSGQSVDLGGAAFQAVNLSVASGPFTLREGWLLLPTNADTFSSGPSTWQSNQTGAANATQANVEVGAHVLGSGHLAFGGSGEWWSARSANLLQTSNVSGLLPAASTTPSTTSNPNATYALASPESPAQATAQQSCLTTGSSCPVFSPAVRGWFGAIVVAGAVATVAVIAAVLVVGQRRRMPPPVFPNAGLYPPGGPTGPATGPGTPPKSPAEPPKDDDDPLGHLW